MRSHFLGLVTVLILTPFATAAIGFSGISESSPTGDPLTFGTPTFTVVPPSSVVADFNPRGFSAVISGIESKITDGRLDFTVMAMDGYSIGSISVAESGGFNILDDGSSVGYGLTVVPTILEVGGVGTVVPLPPKSMSGSESTPEFGNWTLKLDYDVVLAATGLIDNPNSITKVEFALNNTLSAVGSELNSGAFIDKKEFQITASAIPEPSSFVFVGLLGICAMGWKKWQSRAK